MIDDTMIRRRYVRGERPERTPGFNGMTIPPGFALYNAPRPLYASAVPVGNPPAFYRLVWTAPGPEGMLWAGVDLDGGDPDAATWVTENDKLDAARVEFCTAEALFAAGYQHFVQHYGSGRVDRVLEEKGSEGREWVINRTLQLLNNNAITLDG